MTMPICWCGHDEDDHDPHPSGCRLCGWCKVYSPDEEQDYELRGMT